MSAARTTAMKSSMKSSINEPLKFQHSDFTLELLAARRALREARWHMSRAAWNVVHEANLYYLGAASEMHKELERLNQRIERLRRRWHTEG